MTIRRDVHSPFGFADLAQLREAIQQLGMELTADENTGPLTRALEVGGRAVPNSMCVQPMEGCDGMADGSPDELTFRRYRRFAAGGAGLLWFEACAVRPEGRANPRQLWITPRNEAAFARLLQDALDAARQSTGPEFRPFTVLQITHSGRYSRPEGPPEPVIAHRDPVLDAAQQIPPDHPLVTDSELEAFEDDFVEAAKLAYSVGFDAVDVKSCHRYLINELLAAHTREGVYGGSYENRTRFLRNVVGKIKTQLGSDRIVACRLNAFDSHPYPYAWGVDREDYFGPDLEEPRRLARELAELGVSLINVTAGNPYYNPYVNRPHDRTVRRGKLPAEHPLVGVERLVRLARDIRQAAPQAVVVGSGYSWLRHLWPHVAAAELRQGHAHVVGVGRQGFAYPDFAKEIIATGLLARGHSCIACSKCSQIMRDGGKAGCAVFDAQVYGES